MELKIGVPELTRALARAQGIVEKKSTMPILSHVLLEARPGGELTVSATDLDVSVSGVHAAEVTKDGGLAVSARHLFDIVKSLSGEKSVSLKRTPNNHLEVKAGQVEFRLVGLAAEDFQRCRSSTRSPSLRWSRTPSSTSWRRPPSPPPPTRPATT